MKSIPWHCVCMLALYSKTSCNPNFDPMIFPTAKLVQDASKCIMNRESFHTLKNGDMQSKAQHFLRILYPYHTIAIINDLYPPMPTHAIQIASMYSKNLQYVLPTYTKSHAHSKPMGMGGHGYGHPM